VGLQIPVLAENDEDSFARIDKNPALNKIEHPFG
jgi:hypothetical protein